jgi:putative hydroxymethylpyrimidine transport system permease protein
VVLLVVLVAAWEVAARSGAMADALDLDSLLVPAPSEVWAAMWENRSLLADNAWVTLQEVLLGFALALAVGALLAASFHLYPAQRRAVYPLVVASQTIPIIVIAPIFVVWFGFGIGPKVAIVALICFFPIVVNALDGLATAPAEQRRMMRSLGASRLQTFRTLEVPTALPYLLSGARIAVAVAVIGAVFGEWAGASSGLGHLILLDNAQLEVARMFASVALLAVMAIALFGLMALLERRIAWWGRGRDKHETRETR